MKHRPLPKFAPLEKAVPKESATVGGPDKMRPGKLFASFELLRELENGGSGAIWLAQDYSAGRQVDQVALKFLPALVACDQTVVEELRAEILRRTQLKHPNILRVHDLVTSKGVVAIKMEYVDGQSLARRRLTRPNQVFEVRELEKWVRELCEALEFAHKDVGLIHGDIAPENLIVDLTGNLKLKNFGMGTCITNSVSRWKVIHDSSETAPFKSPQRAAGEGPAFTDDLYSLGATVYELLTGKPPFYDGDIGEQVAGKIPPSMTQRRAELGVAGEVIPKHWEETVAACLAKDPGQRPQSASEVEKRLKNTISASNGSAKPKVKPIPHHPAKPQPPFRTSPSRKQWLAIMGFVFVLAFGTAIAFLSFHRDNFLKVANRSAGASPTPSTKLSPTPSAEAIPTFSAEATPTPSAAASPTPSAEASPTPSAEASPTPSAAASPTPSAEASPTPSAEVSAAPSPQESVIPDQGPSAAPSPNPPDQDDTAAIKEEVLRRINAIPGMSAEKKANLIEKMHKARSMARLAVIPFDNGQSALRRAGTADLVRTFNTPTMRDKLSDPTAIVVVAGYADAGGRPEVNLRISQARAEYVGRILKQQVRLLNAMQIIGMGGTELLDSEQPGLNRAVEVWAVVPL